MNNNNIKVGIIGCGFIGTALKTWLEENNKDVQIFVNDPAKGYNDDVYNMELDAYFVQIHVPTLDNGKQDINNLLDIIKKIPKDSKVWIRTTILPSTLEACRKLNSNVEHMPEFLTQRTYIEDFKKQPMVFTGDVELLKKIFPGKKHVEMTSEEASMTKYAHNCFGALKILYFNCIYDLCKKLDLDWNKVHEGVLMSGYINDTHTYVPGHDGKLSYGGKCFPKDVNALEKEFRYTPLGKLMDPMKKLNLEFRGDEI